MGAKNLNKLRVVIAIGILSWLAACGRPSLPPVTGTLQPVSSRSIFSLASPVLIFTETPSSITATLAASETPQPSPQLTPTATPVGAEAIFTKPIMITRGEIQDIAASPDGRWLAVASASGLYLHGDQTLGFERTLVDDVWVSGVAFSPDGRMLAAFGKDWLRLLDLGSAQTIQLLQASLQKLDFTPDGKSLIGLESSGSPALLRIWDLSGWEERVAVFDVEDASRSLALSPDGVTVALGGEYGWVELFDLESAARVAILSEWTGMPVTDLDFSPDGSLLAAADESSDGRLRVWGVEGRKRIVEQYASGYHSIHPIVAFSADGQRLLGGMGDLAVVWERSSGQQVGMLLGYATFLSDVEVSPAGDRLAYATYNWPVYIYALDGQAPPRVLSVAGFEAFNVAFSVDGKNVAAGLYSYAPEPVPGEPDEMVRLWDAETGSEVRTFLEASAAAISPDGGQLALADTLGSLRLVDLESGVEICLPGCSCSLAGGCSLKLPHELSPMELSYSPDGKQLALWGVAGTWSASSLLDLASGEEITWFEGGSRISFGPRGLIALGVHELNADHGIAAHWLVLYDLKQGKELQRVEIPAAGIAALSPDGRWLAVGLSTLEKTNPTGQDPPDPAANGLLIWDVDAWRQVAYYSLPYGVTRLAFSPHGDFLITASETGEILRWNRSP